MSAPNKCAAIANQHGGFDTIVAQSFGNAVLQSLTHMPAERVDGRVVDGDDQNVVMALSGNGLH
jgi:hypothetical protein